MSIAELVKWVDGMDTRTPEQKARDADAQERREFVDADDLILAGLVIGHLSGLALWVQAYIKSLRGEIWDLEEALNKAEFQIVEIEELERDRELDKDPSND